MNETDEPSAGDYAIGVPLQSTEDHLGRLLGRESEEVDSSDLTWKDERDKALDEDDEAMLAENEVENAEDDVIDGDLDLPSPASARDNLG